MKANDLSFPITEIDHLQKQGIYTFDKPEKLSLVREWMFSDSHIVLMCRESDAEGEGVLYKVTNSMLEPLSEEEWHQFTDILDQYLHHRE
jgi:hypothetical protein